MPRKANGRADKHRDDDYRMPGEAPATERNGHANGQPAANGMPTASTTDMSGGGSPAATWAAASAQWRRNDAAAERPAARA